MPDICPICDKKIDSKEAYNNHMQEHVQEFSKNSTTEENENSNPVFLNEETRSQTAYWNMAGKIFSGQRFEKQVERKIRQIDNDDEKLQRQNFVEQIKKINEKNPFLYLPYFIEDFMKGMSTRELENKYHVLTWMDHWTVTHNIFGFKENRYTAAKYDDALKLNLKNFSWENKYKKLQENCEFFKDEINELIFNNSLLAYIIFLLMDKELEEDEIVKEISKIQEHYDRYNFLNDGGYKSEKLINSFDKMLQDNLEIRISEILSNLKQEDVIKRNGKGSRKLVTTFNIDKIKKSIIRELKYEGKSTYITLRNLIAQQFPGLRLIPKFHVFETSWRELEEENAISIEYQSSKRNDFIIFLNETHRELDISIESIERKQSKIPFMGRKITPERFILELNELEKGDFDDADDQVTRLAGLVFAEAVKIQAPHEKIEEFDFTIDIKNYDFRPEQIEAIDTLDFQINAEIMHVKVMIDEVLNLKKYEELKKKVPQNEQGVIITFRKIPQNVKQAIQNDNTIQTIDEEGVRIWVSITPRIPARVNSISKITFDPLSNLENKIVRVNSVLYEKGIALVDVFPEMNEEPVLARTLEEVEFLEATPQTFNEYSEHYHEFLDIMHEISNESELIEAYFTNPIKDADVSSGKIRSSIKFENDQVTINLDEKEKLYKCVACSCLKWQENKSELCKHLITGIDYLVRNSEFLDDTWDESYNKIRQLLSLFLEDNIRRDLDNIIYEIEDNEKDMILDYVSKIIKS
tara:strand:- start:855 stop:3104 length:2250 start_codon:yes stop_codon:yes gene_type:complete